MKLRNLLSLRFLLTLAVAFLFVGIGAAAPKDASATEVCYSGWSGESTYYTTCSDTAYDVVGKTLVTPNYTPVMNQVFLISVAKGQTQTMSQSQTVERKIETSASVSVNLPLFGKIGLATVGTSSGTTTTNYNTTTVYYGPDGSSPYNSRKYYTGTVFDLYNVTIHEYKYTRETIDFYDNGSLLHTSVYETNEDHGTYNEQVKVPHAVDYTVDALY